MKGSCINMRKRIFIGSSHESRELAIALGAALSIVDNELIPIPWEFREPRPGEYFIPGLIEKLNACDFAIFVFSADDDLIIRNQPGVAPRANVVFEYGLAIGILGLDKCFILRPNNNNLVMPTDFLGIEYATYIENTQGNLNAVLAPAARSLNGSMSKFSTPQELFSLNISWKQFCQYIMNLKNYLSFYPGQGGFQFDIIVGLQRGGLVVADMLSRFYSSRIPIYSLFQDRQTMQPNINFDCSENQPLIDHLNNLINKNKISHILITEDITRNGHAIVEAKRYLQRKLEIDNNNIKSAAVVVGEGVDRSIVDYCGLPDNFVVSDKYVQTPISIFDGR